MNPQVPAELEQLVRKALEKSPDKRFASAAEMRAKFDYKRQVLLDSGHGMPLTPWFKETLDWLDHYLGRVK